MIEIGFHTDAFNSAYWSFEQCLQWAQRNDVHWIECGTIDGVSWLHGLGYQPHVSLTEDPLALREKMARYGVRFSQLDAAYPLSLPNAPSLGLTYILNSMRWAYLVGCDHIDTTDHMHKPASMSDEQALEMMKRVYGEVLEAAERYQMTIDTTDHMHKPATMSDEQALEMMKRVYGEVLEAAERYRMTIDIEPHGYYTTKPEFMARMLAFSDSPYLRLNMDTGNTFIAGQDPVAFLERFKHKVSHVHVKDVSASLAAAMRGELTGIAVSATAIGDGVNGDNIRRCFDILVDIGYDGVVSIECEGQGGPMIEKSLAWVRELVADANARIAAKS